MCLTLMTTAGLLQGGAGVVQGLGDYAQGRARGRALRTDAESELVVGNTRAKRIRRAGEQELGSARAQAAASGVKLTSGSVLEVEREIVRNVEQDALSAILTGQRRADSLLQSAKYEERAGRMAAFNSFFGAASKWQTKRAPQTAPQTDRSSFRLDDPYRNPLHVGGEMGE